MAVSGGSAWWEGFAGWLRWRSPNEPALLVVYDIVTNVAA